MCTGDALVEFFRMVLTYHICAKIYHILLPHSQLMLSTDAQGKEALDVGNFYTDAMDGHHTGVLGHVPHGELFILQKIILQEQFKARICLLQCSLNWFGALQKNVGLFSDAIATEWRLSWPHDDMIISSVIASLMNIPEGSRQRNWSFSL